MWKLTSEAWEEQFEGWSEEESVKGVWDLGPEAESWSLPWLLLHWICCIYRHHQDSSRVALNPYSDFHRLENQGLFKAWLRVLVWDHRATKWGIQSVYPEHSESKFGILFPKTELPFMEIQAFFWFLLWFQNSTPRSSIASDQRIAPEIDFPCFSLLSSLESSFLHTDTLNLGWFLFADGSNPAFRPFPLLVCGPLCQPPAHQLPLAGLCKLKSSEFSPPWNDMVLAASSWLLDLYNAPYSETFVRMTQKCVTWTFLAPTRASKWNIFSWEKGWFWVLLTHPCYAYTHILSISVFWELEALWWKQEFNGISVHELCS